MKGLILKDLLSLRKELKIYIVFIAFYTALSIVSNDTSMLAGMICIFCTMLPITSLAYDEKAHWDKYALSTPITRKDLVLSKYILGIFCSSIGALIALVLSIRGNGISQQLITQTIILWAISIAFLAVLLPILLKLGVEKGRLIMMIIFGSPAIIGMILIKSGFPKPNQEIIDLLIKFAPIIAVLSVITALVLSICTSLKIYSKKEL